MGRPHRRSQKLDHRLTATGKLATERDSRRTCGTYDRLGREALGLEHRVQSAPETSSSRTVVPRSPQTAAIFPPRRWYIASSIVLICVPLERHLGTVPPCECRSQ